MFKNSIFTSRKTDRVCTTKTNQVKLYRAKSMFTVTIINNSYTSLWKTKRGDF